MKLLRWCIFLRNEFTLWAIFTTPQGKIAEKGTNDLKRLIAKNVKKEDREHVIPNYPIGCKRVLLSNDYYPTLKKENVTLVTNPIREITPTDIITENGTSYTVDAIVYATGFKVISSLSPKIIGKNGKDLEKSWEDLPQAYLGITVPCYPNLFILLGPNTGLGHNSVVWMIECQVNYAVECLQEMIRTNSTIEVKQEALERYYEKIIQ